jgi:hypothetical protein
MKKLNVFIAALVCSLLFSIGAKAQAPADFFVGKWTMTTTGLPSGDAKSFIVFERNAEGKLTGNMVDDKGKKTIFAKIEEKPTSVTMYFTASGYNVYIFLEKKDDNNLTGSTMDMFDSTAVRTVDAKTEAK